MQLTNDELKAAIEDAAKQIRESTPMTSSYTLFRDHLKMLLEEQARRAICK